VESSTATTTAATTSTSTTTTTTTPTRFDDILRRERLLLAPLVGGSDLTFRLLARRFGARVTYTEMCVARYWLNEDFRRANLYHFDSADRPLVLQLTDTTAAPIVAVANDALFRGHIDALDINLGCPQFVAQRGSFGAFLVAQHGVPYVVDMVRAVVAGVAPLPVTCKIRLHQDLPATIEYVRGLFDAGAVAVTVHGRFLHQKGAKRGDCDWAAIDAIKAAFPDRVIIGNGDVRTHAQLQHRLATSAADAVMVGYGALRDPTLFGAERFELQQVVQEYVDLARRHPNKLIDVKRHIGWLTKQACKTKVERFHFVRRRSRSIEVAAALAQAGARPIRNWCCRRPSERAQRHDCRGWTADGVCPPRARQCKPRARKRALKSIRKGGQQACARARASLQEVDEAAAAAVAAGTADDDEERSDEGQG
jgi:tRNA-dihydrouridine synthase